MEGVKPDSFQILQMSSILCHTLSITIFCCYGETAYDNLSHTVEQSNFP